MTAEVGLETEMNTWEDLETDMSRGTHVRTIMTGETYESMTMTWTRTRDNSGGTRGIEKEETLGRDMTPVNKGDDGKTNINHDNMTTESQA